MLKTPLLGGISVFETVRGTKTSNFFQKGFVQLSVIAVVVLLVAVATLPLISNFVAKNKKITIQQKAQVVPPSFVWQRAGDLPQPAADGVAFILENNLYHAGGWAGDSHQPLAAVYKSVLSGGVPGSWVSVNSLPIGRLGATVTVYNNRAYVLGGYNGTSITDCVDSFDGVNWRSERSLPQPLNFSASAVIGGYLYVAGGLPGSVDRVWSSAIAADGTLATWRSEAPLPIAMFTRFAAWGDCLYTVGGKNNVGGINNSVYNAARRTTDGAIISWNQISTLLQPLALQGIAVRSGILYVIGGETTNSTYNSKVYIAIIGNDCSLSSWMEAQLPNNQPRMRMATTTNERGIYLMGGRLTGDIFVQDTWYDILPIPPTPTPTTGFASNLNASCDSATQARLSWTAAPNATGYNIGTCDHSDICPPYGDYNTINTSINVDVVCGHDYGWWVSASPGSCQTTASGYFNCTCEIPTPTSTIPVVPPTLTPTLTVTPTSTGAAATATPTPTSAPCACPAGVSPKSLGNANCDNKIDGVDFEIWREEIRGLRATKTADFDCSNNVDQADFDIWKQNRSK